jgi:hypothetical protein
MAVREEVTEFDAPTLSLAQQAAGVDHAPAARGGQ